MCSFLLPMAINVMLLLSSFNILHSVAWTTPQSSNLSPSRIIAPSPLSYSSPLLTLSRHRKTNLRVSNNDNNNNNNDNDNEAKALARAAMGIVLPSSSLEFTHLIALPIPEPTEYVELCEILTGVQRAILSGCPLLFDACVVPAAMRIPLLYVDTRTSLDDNIDDDATDGDGGKGDGTSDAWPEDIFAAMRGGTDEDELSGENIRPTSLFDDDDDDDDDGARDALSLILSRRDPSAVELRSIVGDVVRLLAFGESNEEENEELGDDEASVVSGEGGPLSVSFRGLEVDGEGNDALHAVGEEGKCVSLIREMVKEIQQRAESRGWRTMLPPDSPQGGRTTIVGDDADDGKEEDQWRPRIPFMRLPPLFWDNLPDDDEGDGLDDGQNGISPMFWYSWLEESFCEGRAMRLGEVAVYGRTDSTGIHESSFRMPHLRVALPGIINDEGDSKGEIDSKQVENEAEVINVEDNSNGEIDSKQVESGDSEITVDAVVNTTKKIKTSKDITVPQTIATIPIEMNANEVAGGDLDTNINENENDSANAEGDTKRRNNYGNATSMDWRSLTWGGEGKPPPEENPILRELIDKIRIGEEDITTGVKIKGDEGDYLSSDRFAGIWRFQSLPGRISVDEERLAGGKDIDPLFSENIVLRIDGTIAGGPILDLNNNRAAGGTWEFFQGSQDEDDYASFRANEDQMMLRIRLPIPPTRDNFMVMEGKVTIGSMPLLNSFIDNGVGGLGLSSFYEQEGVMEAIRKVGKGTGGIDESSNEDRDLRVEREPNEDVEKRDERTEKFLRCSGSAWAEDCTGGSNRVKLGRFSMLKIKDMNDNDWTYSIKS